MLVFTPTPTNQQRRFVATNYENPVEMIKWYYADPRRLQEVQAVVLEDVVVEWVLTAAKTKAGKVSFEELMDIAK
jgi:trigger factor